mmetsp:Transcript_55885/g.99479  ORF Transcript_55885/g.99479 Transcript_55885/m.99479 type:complete len:91 (-) Transcript_55885:368-640(-)
MRNMVDNNLPSKIVCINPPTNRMKIPPRTHNKANIINNENHNVLHRCTSKATVPCRPSIFKDSTVNKRGNTAKSRARETKCTKDHPLKNL